MRRQALVRSGSAALAAGVLMVAGAAALPAPDFTAPALGGDSLRLAGFRGRVVLVDFWATWCAPCREQLAALADLEAEFADLVVLAVSVDKRRERVERFAGQRRVPRRVLLDPEGGIAERYAIPVLPWAVLVGEDGNVLWQGSHAGEARSRIEKLRRRPRE